MATRKRQKKSRLRGSHTHGWGSKKKHRGSGNRGGSGMAGTGKRAQSKKTLFWDSRYFGRFGRARAGAKPAAINVGDLASIARSHGTDIDLTKMGIARLLGRGTVSLKLTITVAHASAQAQEKIQKAGGTVKGTVAAAPA